jgi:hypothetical protein
MAITLDGTLGITFPSGSVQNNAVANNAAITALVGSRGLSTSIEPTGSILQTVYQNYNTNSSYTGNGSYADTGITATITPQFSTSKIFIIVTVNGMSTTSASSTDTLSLLLTDGSNNTLTGLSGSNIPNYATPYINITTAYVHSPATTSAFTYKVRGKTNSVNWQVNNINVSMPNPNSGIVLMEIAQ